MHKRVERQLVKFFGSLKKVPKELEELFEQISKTYADNDQEYLLMERSLDISSKESTKLNVLLREEVNETKDRVEKLKSLNSMMIDRELKMVELKKENKHLRDELNLESS